MWSHGAGYRLRVPSGEGPHPALLFLHGHGESGTDNEAQLRGGLPPVADRYAEWLIVAPQKPTFPDLWPRYRDDLARILSEVEAAHALAPRRAITGLSQGGHGAIALARALPWSFAAVAAVCGWGDSADPAATREGMGDPAAPFADPALLRERVGGLPLWLFHGERDTVVPPIRSREIAAALPGTRLTLYTEAGHDAWTPAYAEPELPRWLGSA